MLIEELKKIVPHLAGCTPLKIERGCTLYKDRIFKDFFWMNADFDKESVSYTDETEAMDAMVNIGILWKERI